MSPELESLLTSIRQSDAFEELLALVETPDLKPFNPKRADDIETARATWIYASGRLKQHEQWLLALRGQATSQEELP